MKKTYYEQLKSPRWQERRLSIMERDNFTCQECGDTESELNVHHKVYIENRNAWDYPNPMLITLCEPCHKKIHAQMNAINEMIGFMTKEQLYFARDIINMLQLASPMECLKILEFTTSELKERIHV